MDASEEWTEGDALLEVLAWGRNDYVVLRVTPALAEAAARSGTRRAEGTLDDVPVNVGLNRADVLPDTFVYVGPALRRRLGARAGDVVRFRLRPADPDEVPVAADVRGALEAAGVQDAFEALRPARRRRLLMPVEDAVTDATRARRIAALVRTLST